MRSLRGLTVMITGASRGIGEAIALRVARDGANVVLAGRSLSEPSHRALRGTLEAVADKVERAGGRALPIALDVRDEAQIGAAVRGAVSHFGSLDALVNNASAIDIGPHPPAARIDLMHQVNARGALLCGRHCAPHLGRGKHRGHILSLAPPVRGGLEPRWIAPHPGYTMSKYGMTAATLAFAPELCANTLWPARVVATAATEMLERQTGRPVFSRGRDPAFTAAAAHRLLCSDLSGQMLLDEEVLPPPRPTEAGAEAAPVDLFVDPAALVTAAAGGLPAAAAAAAAAARR